MHCYMANQIARFRMLDDSAVAAMVFIFHFIRAVAAIIQLDLNNEFMAKAPVSKLLE